MTKCPYVPPHDFNLDFPHLMLRYRAIKKNNELPKMPYQLAQLDRNGKLSLSSSVINWVTNIKNTFRKIMEALTQMIKLNAKYNLKHF